MRNNQKTASYKAFSATISIGVMLFIILFTSLASAELIFKYRGEINLRVPCSYNGTFCDSTAICNLTVMYPNDSVMVENVQMTNAGNGTPNYTLPDDETIGTYSSHAYCCQAASCESTTFNFQITKSGSELSTSQGIIYVIVLIIAIGLFFACMYGAFKIKWGNIWDVDNRSIISINDFKWVKLICIVFSYILFMWVIWLIYGVTENFLYMEFAARFFYMVFWILLAFLFPVLVVSVILCLVVWFDDRKMDKLIKRGLKVLR